MTNVAKFGWTSFPLAADFSATQRLHILDEMGFLPWRLSLFLFGGCLLVNVYLVTIAFRCSRQAEEILMIPPLPLTIDMISIGTMHQQALQDAQLDTMGSNPMVRNLFRVTEANDTDSLCHTDLTMDHVRQILEHCRDRDLMDRYRQHHKMLYLLNKHNVLSDEYYLGRSSPMGWRCAQKRPIDGLVQVLRQYKDSFPDYLVIMDDDTWINLDRTFFSLYREYPPDEPWAVAGCLLQLRTPPKDLSWPFGGMGTVLTRAALHNLVQPIDCEERSTAFEEKACRQIRKNYMGERHLFVSGMSLLDLMADYTFEHSYLNVTDWSAKGFCLHSDWNLGFFINYYPIASMVPFEDSVYTDSATITGECQRSQNTSLCTPDSAICHYVQPDQMRRLQFARRRGQVEYE